jgi:sulfide:quinone oxidoreductase
MHRHSLLSQAFPNVFALGDATDLPSSKAGSVAHFQGEVLFENALRYIAGRELSQGFDGHAHCFIETSYGKAGLFLRSVQGCCSGESSTYNIA